MREPLFALLWESWRLTRRPIVFITSAATLIGSTLLLVLNSEAPQQSAFVAWLLLLTLSVALAFAMRTVALRDGFPFSRSFVRPVNTATIVAAPMMFTAVAVVLSYLVPAAALRALSGVQFPLLAVAAVLAAAAVTLSACSWTMRTTAARAIAVVVAFHALGATLGALEPVGPSASFPPAIHPELVRFEPTDYLVIGALCALAYGVAVWRVRQERHGVAPTSQRQRLFRAPNGPRSASILEVLRSASTRLTSWRCPTSSPTAAMVWLESQARGMPVLGAGVILALLVPALFALGHTRQALLATVTAWVLTAVPLLLALGASIWNNQPVWRADVTPFEAARPVGSARIVGVQLIVTLVSVGAAYVLIGSGLWVTTKAFPGAIGASPLMAVTVTPGASLLEALATIVVEVLFLATAISLLFALRAFSALYGRGLWIAAIAVAVYALVLLVGVLRDQVPGAVIGAHLWCMAIGVVIGTARSFAVALRGRILTARSIAIVLASWAAFAAIYFGIFLDASFLADPPATRALVFATSLVPVCAAALVPWSYSRVRHR